MDLVGAGASFQEALDELLGLVGAQIGFALFKRQPALIWHPAPPSVLETFLRVQQEYQDRFPRVPTQLNRRIASVPLVPGSRKEKVQFELADA